MATLEENINQAIADFDDIEAAIEEQGVDVPAGTDTKEYGNLIRSIKKGGAVDLTYNPESENAQSGLAVAEALAGQPIKYLNSLDTENIVYMRDIQDGYYIFNGYFRPYPNCASTLICSETYFSVVRKDAGSHLMSISPLNFKITCYEILVDDTAEDGFTYTRTVISLLDLYEQSKAMVKTIDDTSDDDHYPTAKATYTLFENYCNQVNALLETIVDGEGATSE